VAYYLQQTINALTTGSLYALLALGYTMVFGVLRLINFAHGEVCMVGAFVAAFVARAWNQAAGMAPTAEQTWLQALCGFLIAALACGLLGFTIERMAYRPLRKASKLSALITAISISLILQNLAQIQWRINGIQLFGPNGLAFPRIIGTSTPIAWLRDTCGISVVPLELLILGLTAGTLLLLWYIVRYTHMGQAMRAVSINYDAAALMGIPINRTISSTFILGSILAALGGCLYGMNNTKVEPLMGLIPGLKAFVAAVLGGIGNIPGAALGGFMLGIIETAVAAQQIGDVSLSPYRDAVAFVLLIVVLLIRPEGIFGRALPEKV